MADQTTVEELSADHAAALAELERLRSEAVSAVRAVRREAELEPFQVELLKLQRHLEDSNRRMIVLFEGRDAAGKGGTIRRVTRYMNEKHYRVVALGRPTEEQRVAVVLPALRGPVPHRRRDRPVRPLLVQPGDGRAGVRVLHRRGVPQLHAGRRRLREGPGPPGHHPGEAVLQRHQGGAGRRFDRRRDDPLRQWKLSEIDVQAQEHWDDFTERKYAMLQRTSTLDAPWTIIRSENKHQARLNAMQVILNARRLRGAAPPTSTSCPTPEIVVSGAEEVSLMEAERIRSGKFTG